MVVDYCEETLVQVRSCSRASRSALTDPCWTALTLPRRQASCSPASSDAHFCDCCLYEVEVRSTTTATTAAPRSRSWSVRSTCHTHTHTLWLDRYSSAFTNVSVHWLRDNLQIFFGDSRGRTQSHLCTRVARCSTLWATCPVTQSHPGEESLNSHWP